LRVLIIDDDVVSRMVLMHLVAGAGSFDVLEAEDGEDGWAQLQAGARPAIVFCDLRMPRLSGMELLARVRADAVFGGLPFVLVSAAGDAATMEQALGLGATGYIVKPFDGARVGAYLAQVTTMADAAADTDEAPDATARRLGIDADRLLLYLGGLQRQLDALAADIAQPPEGTRLDAVRDRLARLREGCATLGLQRAADGFTALLAQDGCDIAGIRPALDGAGAAVLRLRKALRRPAS